MFKFQLATKADRREAASIESRRRFEDDRKHRIFDARNRVIGVDIQALEMQIEEKRKLDQINKEEEKKFNDENRRRADILKVKEREVAQERARVQNEINEYRHNYQKREDTREYDINDPRHLQNSVAARIGDNDIRLGISSAQKFEGEDLMNPERLKLQRQQQRAWLQQQMIERRTAENDRKTADRLLQNALESRDRRALEMDAEERRARQQIQMSAVNFNKRLAANQESKKQERNREEQEDNMAEIYNNLTSDMLTENTNCTDSNFGVKRKIAANYRGLSDEELQEFYRAQKEQQDKNKNQRNEAKAMDAKWDQMANNMARITILKETDVERKRNSVNVNLREENLRMADEQKARKQHMDKVVFTNRPTAEYFSQFNTSTR